MPQAGGPFADAVAWAAAAGILPGGLAPTDTPTLAAVAEMFYLLCRDCGKTAAPTTLVIPSEVEGSYPRPAAAGKDPSTAAPKRLRSG